jgi:hypothetical protein
VTSRVIGGYTGHHVVINYAFIPRLDWYFSLSLALLAVSGDVSAFPLFVLNASLTMPLSLF